MAIAKRVLFVGSFKSSSSSGHVGGQMYACTSLVGSELTDTIDFIKIDTTASTNKRRGYIERSWQASARLTKFIYCLITKDVATVLIFCSNGFSFREKGLMIMIAKKAGKKCIIAPRSGHLIDDLEQSTSMRRYARRVFDHADFIICQGSFWQSYFHSKLNVPIDKLKVIHNWVSMPSGAIAERSPREVLTILFLGWIEPNKGIYEVIEAAHILRDQPLRWIIGGDGTATEHIKSSIARLDLSHLIDMRGWILGDDKDEAIAESDVLVMPSYREGLPNATYS